MSPEITPDVSLLSSHNYVGRNIALSHSGSRAIFVRLSAVDGRGEGRFTAVMWLIPIFVCAAGFAWLILSRVFPAPSVEHSAVLESESVDEPVIDNAWLNDQIARIAREHVGPMVRMPGGGFKPQSEIDEEDQSIAAFKAELRRWPVPELDDTYLMLFYQGDGEIGRLVQLRAVLLGQRGIYLDCWWPEQNDTRLFSRARIEQILDGEGQTYSDALVWIMRSGAAGAALANEVGFELPLDKVCAVTANPIKLAFGDFRQSLEDQFRLRALNWVHPRN